MRKSENIWKMRLAYTIILHSKIDLDASVTFFRPDSGKSIALHRKNSSRGILYAVADRFTNSKSFKNTLNHFMRLQHHLNSRQLSK